MLMKLLRIAFVLLFVILAGLYWKKSASGRFYFLCQDLAKETEKIVAARDSLIPLRQVLKWYQTDTLETSGSLSVFEQELFSDTARKIYKEKSKTSIDFSNEMREYCRSNREKFIAILMKPESTDSPKSGDSNAL